MKKIIILCITLVVSFAAHAQDYKNSHQYHPWNEFKSGSTPTLIDTIRFLNANFSEYHQNKYFEAKSLEKALQILDQEMPVKQIAYTVWEKDSTLQGIELIFDNRMCSKQFDQFHFFSGNFTHRYTISELRSIFKVDPEIPTELTKTLRKKLEQFVFQQNRMTLIFSAYIMQDPSTLPQEMIQPFENAE